MPGRVAGLSRALRCAIYNRDTWGRASGGRLRICPRCVYCDAGVCVKLQVGESRWALRAATIDHVDPYGRTHPENLVTACWLCNVSKGKRHAADWKPGALERAKRAIGKVLDIEGGRRTARQQYPRGTNQRPRRKEAA